MDIWYDLRDAPFDVKQLLAKEFFIGNALYICSLIRQGLVNEVKNVIRLDNESNNVVQMNNYHLGQDIFMVLPFCYMYYLGFWEEEKYVAPDLRVKVRQLVKDLQYENVLFNDNVIELLVHELTKPEGDILSQLMHNLDIRKKTHIIATGNAVKDFCLFSLMFKDIRSGASEAEWLQVIREKTSYFLDYIKEGNITYKRISDFVEFMGFEKNFEASHLIINVKDNVDRRINILSAEQIATKMYDSLMDEIRVCYKREAEKKISQTEVLYKYDDTEIIEGCKNLGKEVIGVVSSNFNKPNFDRLISINEKYDPDNLYYPVEIFTLTANTQDLKSIFNSQIKFMAQGSYLNLLHVYITLLARAGKIEARRYSTFFNGDSDSIRDREYLSYLESNYFNLMLGSRFLLMNKDIKTSEEFNERTKAYNWVTTNGALYGAVLRSGDVHFYLKNVNASVNPATIKDLNDRVNETASGIYEYKNDSGIAIPFAVEKELSDYIAQEKKVIRVKALVRIEILYKDPVGIYFVKE